MARGPAGLRALIAIGSGLLLSLACGGGGGGGSRPPTVPSESVTFVADSAPTPGSFFLVQDVAASGPTRLVLRLEVEEVEGLFGVAFDLRFPHGILQLEVAEEGTFLTRGGAQTSLQVAERPAGNLVVGLSRLGTATGASGSGLLLTLELTSLASGTGHLTFGETAAFDRDGNLIDSLDWIGGTATVVR